ncbi:MAG: histidine phosphatase family protein [Candidatus Dormibacteria bacterium]
MPSPPLTRLHLVRHCEVRNPQGVLYGHLPGFPLSDKGVQQAHALGEYFAARSVGRILSSPLERAQQTAAIIAAHLDGATVDTTEELIEARFGHYLQGVKPRDVPWRRPLWMVHMVRPGLLPQDERIAEMAGRVRAPLLRLLRAHPGEGGICISHGDPIQAFSVETDGLPARALHRLQCAKGGVIELTYEGETLVNKTYLSPERLGAPAAAPTAGSRT